MFFTVTILLLGITSSNIYRMHRFYADLFYSLYQLECLLVWIIVNASLSQLRYANKNNQVVNTMNCDTIVSVFRLFHESIGSQGVLFVAK